jgi:hypothetical protein
MLYYLKLLEKQDQAKPKTSRRREIIKTKPQINKIENKESIQRINKTKNWFFKKINGKDKHLINLTKMTEKIQIDKIRNEKVDITTNINEIQGIIMEDFEKLYSNKLKYLEEMDKFVDTYEQSKLNQDDINHLNRSITGNEIETVTQNIKVQDLTAEFYQTLKKELTPTRLNFFHKIERKGTLTQSLYEASITLIPKQDKGITKNRIIGKLL